jgi:hypothetical protein
MITYPPSRNALIHSGCGAAVWLPAGAETSAKTHSHAIPTMRVIM